MVDLPVDGVGNADVSMCHQAACVRTGCIHPLRPFHGRADWVLTIGPDEHFGLAIHRRSLRQARVSGKLSLCVGRIDGIRQSGLSAFLP